MALDLLISTGFGADKVTVAEGAGADQPRLLSAVSTSPQKITVTFDHIMEVHGAPSVLKVTKWSVTKTVGGEILPVLQVTQQSDTVFILHTSDQEDVEYTVLVSEVIDVWTQPIDLANDSATFNGTEMTYPALDLVDSFFGLDHGMQAAEQSGFLPDALPPYFGTRTPGPGDTNVSILDNIIIEIKDDDDGVDESTVVITVEGTTVWIGDAAQPGYSITKTAITDGFRYTIDPAVPLPSGTVIDIWVYAKDLSPLANVLDSTYNFTTKAGAGPILSNQLPAANATLVPLDSTISFHVTDPDDDLDASTVLITVDGVVAYSGLSGQNGFGVTRNSIALGYSYVITPPLPFDYGAEIEVGVRADDFSAFTLQTTYSFYTVEDPLCFTGPLTDFEEGLRDPIVTAGATHLEQLRRWLLRNVLTVLHPDRAIRFVYLRAFEHPVSTVLGDVMTAPTSRETDVVLCGRRTNVQINNDLKLLPTLLDRAITELSVLGATSQHIQIFQAYAGTGNPNDRVPIACIVTLLARVLEDNELV
jgi:hypothetical protein